MTTVLSNLIADCESEAAGPEAVCVRLLPHLQASVSAPDDGSLALCADSLEFIRGLTATDPSAARIECLLAIAHCFHLAAQPLRSCASAQAGVDAARACGSAALLRKALTFLGTTQMEGGNFPAATSSFSEALVLAQSLNDPIAESAVWNNLGLTQMYSAQYAEAVTLFHRTVMLAQRAGYIATERSAHSNIASCALHLRDTQTGIAAARRSIALNDAPTTASECLSRAIAEANLARLLLIAGDAAEAVRRCETLRQMVMRWPAARTEFVYLMTRGVVDVHRGEPAVGFDFLGRGLALARSTVRAELGDALSASISAYEAAGQPDVALVYLHELATLNYQQAEERVLTHHLDHLARVESEASVSSAKQQLSSQRGELRAQLVLRDLTRNRMLLLEQQAVAAELHDDVTGEHCYRVGRLASLLAERIGLEADVCYLIDLAARMHDIGKLAIPDVILQKPGRLTAEERVIMQGHARAGGDILAKSAVPQMGIAQEIALHHHEKWNGSGYPAGLSGTSIPISARVAALADVFDALTHARPYKRAWSIADALTHIRRERGEHFDPSLTDVFLRLVPELIESRGDLDVYLAVEAHRSEFIQARRQIARALKGSDPAISRFMPPGLHD